VGLNSATLDTWIGASLSMMPPVTLRCGFGRVWRLTMFTPSTSRRWSSSTRITRPRLPLSRPARTITSSPVRILFMVQSLLPHPRPLQHLGRERDDLHELLGAQLARDRTEHARPEELALVVEQYRGVGVEADGRPVRAAHALARAYDDRVVHVALLDLAARDRLLHAHLDDVADVRVAPLRAAQHLDALDALRAAVVRHRQHALHLDHVCALV